MKESLIDVSVLILFFNRPEPLKQVFEQVRQARPSRLFLYQDGPRNDNDIQKILECRKIVENIDWDCEVTTNYQEKNHGCDPSGYMAQTWAFTLTDKCIILEDDCVPSVSFFSFCKEMLDKYENDERIWMISGFNHEEIFKGVNEDYFFTSFFSIWGWATWRRVVEKWDKEYKFLDDPEKTALIYDMIKRNELRHDFVDFCQSHRISGKAYHETISWSGMILNSALAIVPVKNMINNIGISSDSTHFNSDVCMLPKAYRKIFTMKRYDIDFPLKHPVKVKENGEFRKLAYKTLAWNHPWIKIGRSLEELWLNIKYGNFKNIKKAVTNRLRKWFRGASYK